MKSVMIVFNQANTGRVEYMLDVLGIKGFTFFEQVQGRGTPRMARDELCGDNGGGG